MQFLKLDEELGHRSAATSYLFPMLEPDRGFCFHCVPLSFPGPNKRPRCSHGEAKSTISFLRVTCFDQSHIFVTSLSHTIFDIHLCHTHTPSFTHTHTPSVTPLCHTPSFTPLCHTPSFTHTICHTSLSHTIFHTPLCHTPSFTHIFVTHHLSPTSLTHVFVTHHLSHLFVTRHLPHTHTHTIFHIFVTYHL